MYILKKRSIIFALSFVIILNFLAGCSRQETKDDISDESTPEQTLTEQTAPDEQLVPDEPEWQWTKDSPENQGLDSSALPEIHQTFDSFELLTSVIVKNGYIVDEYYKDGYDETSEFILNSASKSVTSALIGIAIDNGFIESVDLHLSEFLPQILEFEDDRWQQITIRHLLTNTSGIGSTDNWRWNEWRSSDNWLEYILSLPMVYDPGTELNYSTGNTHLLCYILQQATGMSAYEFGKEYLFDLVGMDSVTCKADAQGISDGGNGFSMNVYDMARFGQLFLQQGVWQGQQIISKEWITESTTMHIKRSSDGAEYGYQWWVRTFGDKGYQAYYARGHAGQYIYVVPQIELVVVFTSNYTADIGVYMQLVNDIVNSCN